MPFVHEQLTADGITAFGRIKAVKAVVDIISNAHVASLAVNNGGTGYAVGESFELVGGTAVSGFVARGVVTSVSAGVVTGVRLSSAGAYSALPGVTGAATVNSSLAGNDDLTVDLTTAAATWTVDRDTYADDLTDFEWIATSTKAANAPTVGLQTFFSSGAHGARVLAAAGFDGGQVFAGQPDASPAAGTLIALPGTDPEVYVSVTERRVNVLFRQGNNVQLAVLGLFIPFTDTDANYPLPLCAFGQSTGTHAFTDNFSNTGFPPSAHNASVLNPSHHNQNTPPYYYRDNVSPAWLAITGSGAGSGSVRAHVWPYQQQSLRYSFTFAPEVSGWTTDPFTYDIGALQDSPNSNSGWFDGDLSPSIRNAVGFPGVAPFGDNGRSAFTVQPHIISNQSGNVQIVGIIDGLLNVYGRGLTAFEDLVTESGQRFLTFPDTNSGLLRHWIAMEQV